MELSKLTELRRSFIRDQTAASAVEYGIVVAGIAAVIVLIVPSIGHRVRCLFVLVIGAQARLFPGQGHGPPEHADDPFGEVECP